MQFNSTLLTPSSSARPTSPAHPSPAQPRPSSNSACLLPVYLSVCPRVASTSPPRPSPRPPGKQDSSGAR
ncbi:hypothetical protein O3P69_011630 [Scylla paramamosain]|uniref:Uncharacterized protein n=1 Tax=Scylla paramamosain TaxID=85552 RepID=A0AAW0T7C3_SCYPA